MNRDRFKFRVWDNKTARYLDCHNSPMIGIDGGLFFFQKDNVWTTSEESDRYIVEQCTGLKDRNGKLIYEGDIVSFQSRGLFFEGTVVWTQEEVFSEINLGRFHIKLLEYQGCEYEFMDYSRDRDSLEVVGNIHEK